MKLLVLLALVTTNNAASQFINFFDTTKVLQDGHLADTPEVAAAKAFHFAEYAKALNRVSAPAVFLSDFSQFLSDPLAIHKVLPDGHLADTPEVAAAKAFHFAEYAKALNAVSDPAIFLSDFNQFHSDSLATPEVLPDGHLADTSEVATAKALHFAEYAKALNSVSAPAVFLSDFIHFLSDPLATPKVLPDGHLADTPEVAAAKALHFAEYAKALNGVSAPSVSFSDFNQFHSVPLATSNVLPDGHLADTSEVAAAKIAHFTEHARTLADNTPPDDIFSTGVSPYDNPNYRS